MNRVEPRVYIDLGISIDQGGIKRCQEQKLDRSRDIEEMSTTKSIELVLEGVEQKESLGYFLEGSGYQSRGTKKNPKKIDVSRKVMSFFSKNRKINPKNLDRRGLC